MNIKNIFNFITNCLGLNFYYFRASFAPIFVFQLIIQLFGFYLILYYPIFAAPLPWYWGHGIYGVTATFQSVFPLLIQNFLIIRAFVMRNQQKLIAIKLRSSYIQEDGKYEQKFIFRMFLIICVRFLKYCCIANFSSGIYYFQSTFAELIYSSNDLMFVYYVELLIEYLDYINHKVQTMRTQNDLKIIKMEIFEVFKLKRKILNRYSIDIFITISYNFVLLIISFYWVVMRLIFNYLKTYQSFGTFTHFPIPIFVYWLLFSRCERFYLKVRHNIND
jgi:hypothetical protein